MAHTPKKFHSVHIYFTKSEESPIWILYSSLLCLINHPDILWYILTQALQATQSQYQMNKGDSNLLCKTKIQNQEGESKSK